MQDTPESKKRGRRTFLKGAGTTAAVLGVPGVAAARGGQSATAESEVVEVAGSKRVGPDTPGLSAEENAAYNEQMRLKYGDQAVWGIEPDGVTTDSHSVNVEGCTFLNSWPLHLEAEDGNGDVVVESDNKVSLYECDKSDEFDRDYYLYWHWSAAQSQSGTGWEGNIYNFWNRVTLNSGYEVVKYTPDQDHTGQDLSIPIDLSAEPLGLGASTSGEIVLRQNTLRPHPDYSAVGDNGVFAVQWIGDYEGSQSINGSTEERRPNGAVRDFEYYYYVKGSKFPKTI